MERLTPVISVTCFTFKELKASNGFPGASVKCLNLVGGIQISLTLALNVRDLSIALSPNRVLLLFPPLLSSASLM